MIVQSFTVGPFQENTYLLIDDDSHHAVLIDPGDDGNRLLLAVEQASANLDAIWLTHAHVDHVGGIAAIKRVADVPVYLHPLDRPLYDNAKRHGEVFGLRVEAPPPPEKLLADGDTLRVGSLSFAVMHTPGHAPGHVVIHGHGIAFAGDCLFSGSIGRTDLPFSDGAELARSLERICALPIETIVYAGHGPSTTIGEEIDNNPFLNGTVRISRR